MPSSRPGVEAECVQPALQFGDVVAAQHRSAEVQQAVAERVPALDERGPRLVPDDAVDAHAPMVLEREHRAFRRGTEVTQVVTGQVVTERDEPLLEIADGLSATPAPDEFRRGHGG